MHLWLNFLQTVLVYANVHSSKEQNGKGIKGMLRVRPWARLGRRKLPSGFPEQKKCKRNDDKLCSLSKLLNFSEPHLSYL